LTFDLFDLFFFRPLLPNPKQHQQQVIRLDPRLRPGGPEGRSLVASEEPIEPGTAFLVVPRDVLLHADHSLNDPEYSQAFASISASCSSASFASASDSPEGKKSRRSKKHRRGKKRKSEANGEGEEEREEEDEAQNGDGTEKTDDEDDGPLDDRDRLCLLLMIERSRGPRSKWHPYIASLPKKYDDPLWWRGEARTLLEGSRAGAAAAVAGRSLERLVRLRARLVEARAREIEEAQAAGGGEEEGGERNPLAALSGAAAMEDARWARSTVWSRAFNLPPVGSRRATLLPVGDMLDHDPGAAVRWSAGGGSGGEEGGEEAPAAKAGEGDFVFETLGGVPAGTAVSSNYGHKSNEELLVGYGFILQPRNDADFFHFSLGIGGGGETRDLGVRRRRARLVRLGVPLDAYCTRLDPLPRSALVAACAALAEGVAGLALDEVEATETETGTETEASPVAVTATGEAEATTTTKATPSPPPPCIEVRPAPTARSPPASLALSDMGVPCPPETQLRAVAALRAALRARTRELGGGGAEEDEALAREAASEAQGDRHSEMALLYRAAQKRLAEGAEAALSAAAGRAVRAAAGTTAELFGFPKPEGEGEGEGGGKEAEAAAAAPGRPLLEEVGFGGEEEGQQWRRHLSCCAAPASAAWSWGVSLPRRGCRRGEVLAVVPGAEMISAEGGGGGGEGGGELAAALLCAAARAGLFLGESESGDGDGDCDGEQEEARKASLPSPSLLLARRLASAVPLPPSLRVYHSPLIRRGDGGEEDEEEEEEEDAAAAAAAAAESARSLLDGSPLGEALLDAASELRGAGREVFGAAARALSLLEEKETEAAGAASSPSRLLLRLPDRSSRAAERAGAWALAVVEGAAVPGPLSGVPVLAPLASAVPRCFRGAAVDFEWVREEKRNDDDGREEESFDPPSPSLSLSLSSFSLVIRAAADLPRGLELRRGCSLVGRPALDVAAEAGLEALAALQPLLQSPPNPPPPPAGGSPPFRARPIPRGHGGQAVWHCFEQHDDDEEEEEEEEEEGAPPSRRRQRDRGEAAALARRAAVACGLPHTPSSPSQLLPLPLLPLGLPTPRRFLAACALSLLASPSSSREGEEGEEEEREREGVALLKRAGIKRLLRARKGADAAAAAASASSGAGRDDAAATALEAELAADAFVRGLLGSSLGGRARAALRQRLLPLLDDEGRAAGVLSRLEIEEEEKQKSGSSSPSALVAGARVYRRGLLAALKEHAAALEEEEQVEEGR